MILDRLSIVNYKNIAEAELTLSPKINCFIGDNGAGKTNVLDVVRYLSLCRSATTASDSEVIRHGADFLLITGEYTADTGEALHISCGVKRGQRKHFKLGGKEYQRLADHIGLIPLVVVAPSDQSLLLGQSEERRRLLDIGVAQQTKTYLHMLDTYNDALRQRNAILKREEWTTADSQMLDVYEEMMGSAGDKIYTARAEYMQSFAPTVQEYYSRIAGDGERVEVAYRSHGDRGPLVPQLRQDRERSHIVGYSLHGVHRDDLEMTMERDATGTNTPHALRLVGSQGQQKSFVVALKLASFDCLATARTDAKPLLLLDDIFDKLDATRVERIVHIVSEGHFGQIFITDTNRDHLDQILAHDELNHKMFFVKDGQIMQNN